MTQDVKVPLRNLAGEFGVSLAGLDDDQLHAVAIRFLVNDDLRAVALQRVVDDVRRGEHKQGAWGDVAPPSSGDDTPSAPPSKKGYRFNATEADAKARQKLAAQHLAESRRTGLYIVPRRPEVLPAGKPHPACLAAVRDGLVASVCPRPACQWLLGKDDPYIDAHLDDDD